MEEITREQKPHHLGFLAEFVKVKQELVGKEPEINTAAPTSIIITALNAITTLAAAQSQPICTDNCKRANPSESSINSKRIRNSMVNMSQQRRQHQVVASTSVGESEERELV